MASYSVTATNWATTVENKIHDDEVARRYGFGGGLVPGVTLYAYITRPLVDTWGHEWLEHGRADVRFVSPVYDGQRITITLDDGRIELRNPEGTLCALGEAGLAASTLDLPAVVDTPLPTVRPPADERTLAPGTDLATVVHRFHGDKALEYLDLIGDDHDLYRRPPALAHPGWLLLDANDVLVQSVALGPWIHVASAVHHLRPVTDGQEVRTMARVTDNVERKGHRFVRLDVVTTADGIPASVVDHTAIWSVRQST
ncbi:MAG: hypothetical protein NVS1B12_10550 [Acidimicrobiales bacterium]